MHRVRILLVDDHELFRESLAGMLAFEPDLEIVGQAGDGFQALQGVRDTNPDLVLMDISMPICDGLEATHLVHAAYPAVRILILTVNNDDESVLEALKAGAHGYVLKDTNKVAFLRSIRQVLADEVALSPKHISTLVRAFRHTTEHVEHGSASADDAEMTPRERDVLELIVAGATNAEIAEQLTVNISTVKSHVRNILRKLNAGNRQEAAMLAVRRGIVAARRDGRAASGTSHSTKD